MMDLVGVYRNLPLPPGQVVGIIVGVTLDRMFPARLPSPRAIHRVVGALLLVSGGRSSAAAGTALAARPTW
jgi:hypothetical protein